MALITSPLTHYTLTKGPLYGERRMPPPNPVYLDSRLWDPNWKCKDAYWALHRTFALNMHTQTAHQAASFESRLWGRDGRGPTRYLKSIVNYTKSQLKSFFSALDRVNFRITPAPSYDRAFNFLRGRY